MLEPQSTLFFLVLLALFAGLMWWLIKAKHIAVRLIAAIAGSPESRRRSAA